MAERTRRYTPEDEDVWLHSGTHARRTMEPQKQEEAMTAPLTRAELAKERKASQRRQARQEAALEAARPKSQPLERLPFGGHIKTARKLKTDDDYLPPSEWNVPPAKLRKL